MASLENKCIYTVMIPELINTWETIYKENMFWKSCNPASQKARKCAEECMTTMLKHTTVINISPIIEQLKLMKTGLFESDCSTRYREHIQRMLGFHIDLMIAKLNIIAEQLIEI